MRTRLTTLSEGVQEKSAMWFWLSPTKQKKIGDPDPTKPKKIGDPGPTKRKKLAIRAPQNQKNWRSGPHKTKKIGDPGPTKRKNLARIWVTLVSFGGGLLITPRG